MTFSESFVADFASAYDLDAGKNPNGYLALYGLEIGFGVRSNSDGYGVTKTERGSAVDMGPRFSDADLAGRYILQKILSASRVGQPKPRLGLLRKPAGFSKVREGAHIRISWDGGWALFRRDWLGTPESKEFARIATKTPEQIWELYRPQPPQT